MEHREVSLILNTPLEVFVHLYVPTDLPLERTPSPIIHFHMRLFVPAASKDVVMM
jgi:hypothetical protein